MYALQSLTQRNLNHPIPKPSTALDPAQVPPGTATNFTSVAVSHRRKRSRALLQSGNMTVLPPGVSDLAAGSSFLPSCPISSPCQTAAAVAAFVTAGSEQLLQSECIPVSRIKDMASVMASSLQNDTLYRVMVVTTDLAGHQGAWSALVHTQDLTPPVLTVVDLPAPGFTSFDVVVALDEPGVVFVGLSLATQPAAATQPACPPSFQVGLWQPQDTPVCVDSRHACYVCNLQEPLVTGFA